MNLEAFESHNNVELRLISNRTGKDYLDLLVENVARQEAALLDYHRRTGKLPNEEQEVGVYLGVLHKMKEEYR